MKDFRDYISESPNRKMTWKSYVMKTVDGKVADWIELSLVSDNKRFIITKHKNSSTYKVFDRRHPKTSYSFKTLQDAKDEADWAFSSDPSTEWHPSLREGSHDFKDFKDPWARMSPEDRKEAGRLQIAALKAFPSSPRQRELRAKLNLLLKKYGLLKGGDK